MGVIALVIAILSPAGAGGRYQRVTLHFTETLDVGTTVIDTGEPGLSVGDYNVGESLDPLYNARGTRRVGSWSGHCMTAKVVSLEDFSTIGECDWTFAIRGRGTITVEGRVPFGPFEIEHRRLAVTGGTGDFRTAHGTLLLSTVGEEQTFDFVFKLYI